MKGFFKRLRPNLELWLMLLFLGYMLWDIHTGWRLYQPEVSAAPVAVTDVVQKGMDVSHYQQGVDWEKIADGKVAFSFVKATQGASYIDPVAARHAKGAHDAGIAVGFYHFFDPTIDPLKQAKHFVEVTGSLNHDLRPVIDVEVTHGADSATIVRGVQQWIGEVEKVLGCEVIIYTGKSFWESHLEQDFAGKRLLWLAEYRKKDPDGNWMIWQESQDGRLVGYEGNIDLDILRAQDKGLEAIKC